MLQLKNATPFAGKVALLHNERGVETLYTMVKGSFRLENSWVLSEEQIPPQPEDEYWSEPGKSSIRIASDFHTGKPATDIIVLGEACAYGEQLVSQLDVEVSVGKVSKAIRVFGDRCWQDGKISTPKVFKTMPIVYEKAFGGSLPLKGDKRMAEERNPVGRGFKGNRTESEMEGVNLPNIEDPLQLISSTKDCPSPAGFGYCSPEWLPRRNFAGTYDEQWQTTRAPYLPHDYDSQFLNAAHPDFIYPGFLEGGEQLRITNMNPDGEINAILPQVGLSCEIRLNQSAHKAPFLLETLILEPNKKQISIVWRSAFECDKKAAEISEIEVKLTR